MAWPGYGQHRRDFFKLGPHLVAPRRVEGGPVVAGVAMVSPTFGQVRAGGPGSTKLPKGPAPPTGRVRPAAAGPRSLAPPACPPQASAGPARSHPRPLAGSAGEGPRRALAPAAGPRCQTPWLEAHPLGPARTSLACPAGGDFDRSGPRLGPESTQIGLVFDLLPRSGPICHCRRPLGLAELGSDGGVVQHSTGDGQNLPAEASGRLPAWSDFHSCASGPRREQGVSLCVPIGIWPETR